MEAKLQSFIETVETLSDLRNLDNYNPVILQLEHPVSGIKYQIAGSKVSPAYMGFPVYGTWVVLDPTSEYYHQALILKDVKDTNTVTDLPDVNNVAWWHVVRTYDEIFANPQYYLGATGLKGDKGDKGDTGDTGPAGAAGPALDPLLVVAELQQLSGTLILSGPDSITNGSYGHFTAELNEGYIDFYNNIAQRTVPDVPAIMKLKVSDPHAYFDSDNNLHVHDLTTEEVVTVYAYYPSWANIVVGQKDVTLKTAVITGLTISGNTSMYAGKTNKLTATAQYSDGTQAVVTPAWSLDVTTYASINASGTITAQSNLPQDEVVNVTASVTDSQGSTITAAYQVTIKKLVATALVINGSSTVKENTTATYTATVTLNSGDSATVTPTWAVNAGAPAVISTAGLFTAGNVSADTAVTLTATYTVPGSNTVTATKAVNVTNVVVPIEAFWGVGAAATSNYSALVNGLPNRGSSGDLTNTFELESMGTNSYCWYAYPKSYGLAQFFDPLSNFTGGWGGAGAAGDGASDATNAAGVDTPVTASVTINGVAVDFYIYRSEHQNLGVASANKWVVQHQA